MKKEIKERIEAVRLGEVPEGYISENHQLRPADWQYEKIGKYLVPYDEFSNDTEVFPLATSSRQGLMLQSEYYGDQRYEETSGGFHVVPEGYVTYRHMSDDDIFRFNVNKMGTPVLVSPEYPVFTTAAGLDQDLLIAYLNNMKEFTAYCSAQKKGSTRTRMYFSRLSEFAMPIPPIVEQRKIAEILATCDRAIELKREEVDGVNKLKRSLNNLLFPCSGENAPMLRFPGFGEGWQRQKLLSCIEKITDFRGRTPKKLGMEWSEDGYLALSALNVKDGYIDFSQDVHYGDEALYSKWMRGNELHKGQVVFTTEAPMGNVAQIPDDRGYILSQRTIAFDVKEAVITEDFLAILLRTPTVLAALNALSTGGTAKGVSQRTLADLDVVIPTDLREQEAIAALFTNLNKLIRLHQQELEELQNKKQALMQLLLTGLVRV